MGRKQDISPKKKGRVLAMSEDGHSSRVIAKKLFIDQKTVCNILKKDRLGLIGGLRKNCGRKVKTSARVVRALKRIVEGNRKLSSRQVANQLTTDVGVSLDHKTVLKELRKCGIRKKSPKKKPCLTQGQMSQRLRFIELYESKPDEFWNHVIFSDEKKFNLFGHDGGVKLWIGEGEELKKECVVRTQKFSQSVMIWGCFSARGTGRLEICKSTINGEKYISILERKLIGTIRDQKFDDSEENYTVFQEDNAPCHTAKTVQRWMRQNKINRMWWPANSPDMNPIENLWAIMSRKLALTSYTTLQGLIENIIHIWHHEIDLNLCKNLASSMPQRIAALKEAKGGYTKY